MQGDSPPRITTRSGSLRVQLLGLQFISSLGTGAPPPLNTQSGGCRRIRTSFGGSSGPPPARVRQDRARIRAEGWVMEGVRAGYRPYPGRRVGDGGGSGRISTFSGPKGWRWRGFGQDIDLIRAEGWGTEGVRAGDRPYPGRRVASERSDGAGGGLVIARGYLVTAIGCGGACRGDPVGLPARDWRGLGEGQAGVRRGSGEGQGGPAGA